MRHQPLQRVTRLPAPPGRMPPGHLPPIDLRATPPDPRLIDRLGPLCCAETGLLPWRQAGGVTVIAAAQADVYRRHAPMLGELFGPVVMVLAPEAAIRAALVALRGAALVKAAETRAPAPLSCRHWKAEAGGRRLLLLAIVLAVVWLAPQPVVTGLLVWTLLTLALGTGLKAAAVLAALRPAPPEGPPPVIARLPCVSILVPLLHETGIAAKLVGRLARLDYPSGLLDIVLVVEEGDRTTAETLAAARLPPTMRVVTVPGGPLKTKPRALNFALPFCRGEFIGVYDAEDAPAPDQIRRIVTRFHQRGEQVACLQGRLDFYNARSNAMSRCFAVEYATWFRLVLPGLARLGLPIPLGGTTLFFRRAALEAVGGWDAHNVTEDADLGLRLARLGYRAELIDTDTLEEATCHPRGWVRQRSRWIKGYMVTWIVHSRRPLRLWRDLGTWRTAGVQVLFLGAISQALLAPLLWACWLMTLGLPNPLAGMPAPVPQAAIGLFLLAETVNLAAAMIACRAPQHRHLRRWVPALWLYFPLASLAALKALWDLAGRPFHWDKTPHGLCDDLSGA